MLRFRPQAKNALLQGTGKLESVGTADWTDPTIPSWRHSIWVGIYDPWRVIFMMNPRIWYKVRLPMNVSQALYLL